MQINNNLNNCNVKFYGDIQMFPESFVEEFIRENKIRIEKFLPPYVPEIVRS